MTIIRFAASTLLGLAAATGAHAAQSNEDARVPAVATTNKAATPMGRIKRYCITDRRDGAPRRPKVCRTREDWQARGFDPLIAIGQL